MSQQPAQPAPKPFRILWNDRPVASFESATGLDPWGRGLQNVTDKLVGDVQDRIRAAVLPGAPTRDEGTWHTVTFQRGTISDPAFATWAGSADDEEQESSGERADLRVDMVDLDGKVLDRYVLRRCSAQRLVGRPPSRTGTVRVTRLEVGCAGWDWDTPDGPTVAGSAAAAAAGRGLGLPRTCWKGAVVGAVVGSLVTSALLAPRLRSGTENANVPPGAVLPVGQSSEAPLPGNQGSVPEFGAPDVPPPRQKPTGQKTPIQEEPSPAVSPSPTLPPLLPPDHSPVAADDAYTAYSYTPLTIDAPGVLSNDQDPDGDALTAVLVSPPTYGTVTLNADGSFTYTSEARYSGPDAFTYRAVAGSASSEVATVQIDVLAD